MPNPDLPESITINDPGHIAHSERLHAAYNKPAPIVQHYGLASYTLQLSDANSFVEFDNGAGTVTVTIPANSTAAFPVGALVHIFSRGSGALTVTPAGGVNLISPGNNTSGSRTLVAQVNSEAQLIKRAADWWNIVGELA